MVKGNFGISPLQVRHFVTALAVFQSQVVYHVRGIQKTQQLQPREMERLVTS